MFPNNSDLYNSHLSAISLSSDFICLLRCHITACTKIIENNAGNITPHIIRILTNLSVQSRRLEEAITNKDKPAKTKL